MLNKNTLIKKEEQITSNFSEKARDIVFASDFKYSKYIGIAIHSILENNSENYCFHIFINDISSSDLEKLKSLPYKNVNIFIYWINDEAVKNLQANQRFSTGMYYRLLAPYILYKKIELFLYLDVDILCINSLSEIFSIDLRESILAAVEDNIEISHLNQLHKLGLNKNSKYFNSGVMYINSNRWVEDKITEQFLELINKSTYIYPDQDVLNIILSKSVKLISDKFNYKRWEKIPSIFFQENNNEIAIIHFIGPFKPWSISGYNNLYNYYKYRSLWKEQHFEKARNSQEFKKAFRSLWKEGHKISSILYYIKYLIIKIKGN